MSESICCKYCNKFLVKRKSMNGKCTNTLLSYCCKKCRDTNGLEHEMDDHHKQNTCMGVCRDVLLKDTVYKTVMKVIIGYIVLSSVGLIILYQFKEQLNNRYNNLHTIIVVSYVVVLCMVLIVLMAIYFVYKKQVSEKIDDCLEIQDRQKIIKGVIGEGECSFSG